MINPIDIGAMGDGIANDGAFLAAAVMTGKHIYLPDECTFLIDGTQLQAMPGQRFFGGGKLLKTTVPLPVPITAAAAFIDVTCDGVEIDGIGFECTQSLGAGSREYGVTALGAKDLSVRNCRFSGSVTPAFIFRNCSGAQIKDNTMRSNGDETGGAFGIATGGDRAGNTDGLVTDIEISGNLITGYVSEAIDLNWDTQRVLISGNRCIANNSVNGEEEIDIGGGDVNGCRDILITGNIIDGGLKSRIGITIKKATQVATKKVSIIGNIIRALKTTDVDGAGIVAIDSNDLIVANNHIYVANKGVYLRIGVVTASVENNTIQNMTTDGIFQGSACGNNRIRGNSVSVCATGLRFAAAASGCIVAENGLVNNGIDIAGQANLTASIVKDNL